MKTSPRTSMAERAGRTLGRAWRGLVRQEARAVRWAAGKGMSVQVAKTLLWAVKLAALGILLFVAFWLALLLAFAAVAAWLAQHHDEGREDKQPEWRDGHSGVGWYDKDNFRTDLGDPDKP